MASINGSGRTNSLGAISPVGGDAPRATGPSLEGRAPGMGDSRHMLGGGNNRFQANLTQQARTVQHQRDALRESGANSPKPTGPLADAHIASGSFEDHELEDIGLLSAADRPGFNRNDSGLRLPIPNTPAEARFSSMAGVSTVASPIPRTAGAHFAQVESGRSTPIEEHPHTASDQEEFDGMLRDMAQYRPSPAPTERTNTPALHDDPPEIAPEIAPETSRRTNRPPVEGLPNILESMMHELRGPNGDQEVTRGGLRDGISQKIDELEPEIGRHKTELQDLQGRQPAPGSDAHAAWQAEWHQKTQDMHDLLDKKHALVMEKEKILEEFERKHPKNTRDPDNPMEVHMAAHRQMMTQQMESQMNMMKMSQEFESIQTAMSILQKAHQTQNDLLSGSFSHSMESFLKNAI